MPNERKKSKWLVILILRRLRGGPVEGFMGGASIETFSGEAQLKKPPCIKEKDHLAGQLTRPSILCVTHQMSRKKRDYSVD